MIIGNLQGDNSFMDRLDLKTYCPSLEILDVSTLSKNVSKNSPLNKENLAKVAADEASLIRKNKLKLMRAYDIFDCHQQDGEKGITLFTMCSEYSMTKLFYFDYETGEDIKQNIENSYLFTAVDKVNEIYLLLITNGIFPHLTFDFQKGKHSDEYYISNEKQVHKARVINCDLLKGREFLALCLCRAQADRPIDSIIEQSGFKAVWRFK
jgi:hypothetical protein